MKLPSRMNQVVFIRPQISMKKNRKRTLFVLQGKLWNLAQHVSQAAWLQLCMLLSLIASATFKKYGSCNPSPLKRFRPEMSEGFTKSELKPVCPSPWHKKTHRKKGTNINSPKKRGTYSGDDRNGLFLPAFQPTIDKGLQEFGLQLFYLLRLLWRTRSTLAASKRVRKKLSESVWR